MATPLEQAGPTQTTDQSRVLIIFSGLMLALLIFSLDQTIVSTCTGYVRRVTHNEIADAVG